MTPLKLERLAAASGLVFALLLLAARLLVGEPVLPELQAGGLVRSYYLTNGGRLAAQGVLAGLASVFGLAFLASLTRVLWRQSRMPWLGPVVLAAGTAATALELASAASLSALVEFRQAEVLGATGGNAGGALALFQLYQALGRFTAWPLLALVAAVTIGGRSTGLPAWLTGLGGVVALAMLLEGIGPDTSLGPITLYGFLAWVAATSLLLTRRRRDVSDEEASSSAVA
jgi:hypothetical protein